MSTHGIKQWPLAGSLTEAHGKQVLGPNAVMFACEADGQGGWVTRPASPVIRHEVRPTGESHLHTGLPISAVYSIDALTGRETRWLEKPGV